MDEKKKINVLIISGIVTDEHDPRMVSMIRYLLESTGRFEVKVTEAFKGATAETLEDFDLVFLHYDGRYCTDGPYISLGEKAEKALFNFVMNGGGCIVYHSAFILGNPVFPDEYCRLVGCKFTFEEEQSRKSPKLAGIINFVPNAHEIIKGFPPYFITEQEDFFINPTWLPDVPITVLATVRDEVKDYLDSRMIQEHIRRLYRGTDVYKLPGINTEQPVAWIHNYGNGRVFTVSIGHGPLTLAVPAFDALLVRGAEWAATGEVTIPYPDLEEGKRKTAWPYYRNRTIKEYALLKSF
ncbi:MAG: ThuA domain-containing protein [Bilifractor sp.]|jgi:type 1 glutamine amidotransferase